MAQNLKLTLCGDLKTKCSCGGNKPAEPPKPTALTELENTIATQINTVSEANVAAQIRARLALYQETVPFAMKLTKL
jgi:hypothetical protein